MRPETATGLFEFLCVKLLELEPKDHEIIDNIKEDSMAPMSRIDTSIDQFNSQKLAENNVEFPAAKPSTYRYRDNRRQVSINIIRIIINEFNN